jgi:predicted aldo/keto reductase-like oxidoreductase
MFLYSKQENELYAKCFSSQLRKSHIQHISGHDFFNLFKIKTLEFSQCTRTGVSVGFIHFVADLSMAGKIGLIGFGNNFPPTIFSRDSFVQG